MDSQFKTFLECLELAGEKIEHHYFHINVVGGDEPIKRERVYCYELYHQLRTILVDDFSFKLDGELDKISHPGLSENLIGKKPDFVVHTPGQMDRNLVVIEVKHISADLADIRVDLVKLNNFLNDAKYFRAIMLIYGSVENGEFERIKNAFPSLYDERLLLYRHKAPMEKPEMA